MKKYLVKSLDEMESVAEKLLGNFSAQKSTNSAKIISLSGDLGSGKTTFVQKSGKILNIKEKINSPTFVISKIYNIKNENYPWKNLIHIDAYRLKNKNDIKNIGLEEQIKNPENLIMIEWAEIIWKKLPKNFQKVNFEYISENEREIEF